MSDHERLHDYKISQTKSKKLFDGKGTSQSNATSEATSAGSNTKISSCKITCPPSGPTGLFPPSHSTTNASIFEKSSDSAAAISTKTSNSLIVNTRQKGNPILKFVRNVPWEFGDIIPDYILGQTTCALYLSLRYHALNPNYIHERLKQLGYSYDLRVLLVQVDTKNPHFALKQLAKVCILTDCTLLVAWSPEEAGRYLETYKSYETKTPDLIVEKTESDFMLRITDVVTTVKKVNKTDAMTLMTVFGSFQKAVMASHTELSLCPGFGPQKAKRLHTIFHEDFVKTKKAKASPDEKAAG